MIYVLNMAYALKEKKIKKTKVNKNNSDNSNSNNNQITKLIKKMYCMKNTTNMSFKTI